MKVVMLDTNVVLDFLHDEKKAKQKLIEFKDYSFAISFLVYAEVMAGAQIRAKKDTRKFLKKFMVYNYEAKAQSAATIFLNRYFTGRENKPMDLLIAAHAKALNVPIITNNAKDFIFKEVTVYHYNKS